MGRPALPAAPPYTLERTCVCMCLGIGPLLRDTIRARGGVKSDKTPRGFTHRSGKPSQGGRQARRAPQSRAVKLRTYTGRHGSCRLRGGCMIRGRAGHRPVAHARSSLRRGPGARGGERVLGYARRGHHPPRLAARDLLRARAPACPRRRLASLLPDADSAEHQLHHLRHLEPLRRRRQRSVIVVDGSVRWSR